MEQYLLKSAVVAEIDKLEDKGKYYEEYDCAYRDGNNAALCALKGHINTLEVKELDNWHLQSKEDIYDAVKDWGLYKFVCIMKDGTIQRFNGSLDEDCEGHVHVHIDGVNEDYDNVDDIVYWIEIPTKVQKGEEV